MLASRRPAFSVVFRHGGLAEPGHGRLHPGAPVMPEPPVPAWKHPHVDPEAPALPQLLASPEPSVSLSWENRRLGVRASKGK